MLNFLNSIVDTIVSLITFIVHSIQSLMNLLLNMPKYITYLINSILNVPTIFIPFLTASIYIYVMYLITNRNLNQ